MLANQTCLRCGQTDATLVAEGTDRLYRTTAEQFRLVRCVHCGMMRLSPRPEPDTLHRYYPPEYWFDPDESRASRLAERYRRIVLGDHLRFVLRAHAASPGRLLDVGCGGGLLAGMLRERNVDAVGFDSSRGACRIAWTRHGVPAATGDLLHRPFHAGAFSTVTMFHVLEHVPTPSAFLVAARDLLAPDGRLIIHVPNPDSWQSRILGRRWNGFDIPRHLNHFRPVDLRYILEKCGFELVRIKHFSLRDNPAGLAISLAPTLDPMARQVRGKHSGLPHLAAHLALVIAAFPFALLEAMWGHGSTIMVEARKR